MSSYQVSTSFAGFKSFDVSNDTLALSPSWHKIILITTLALTIIGIILLVCSATVASSPMLSIAGAIVFDLGWPLMIAASISLAIHTQSKKLKEQKKLNTEKNEVLESNGTSKPTSEKLEKKKHSVTIPNMDQDLSIHESNTVIFNNLHDLDISDD